MDWLCVILIWILTYMYVYSDFYRLYRLLLWGFVIKVKLGKKNK